MKLSIYNYHYFREDAYSSGIYPVTDKTFRRQLDALSRKHDFISQEELIELIKSGIDCDKDYCLITFDDGLAEQMRAFGTLKELGVPAIFYVSSDPLKEKKCLDVHKVHYIRSVISDKELYDVLDIRYNISLFKFDESLLAKQYKYDNELSRKVKFYINFILDSKQRAKVVDEIFHSLVSDEEKFAEDLYMTKEDMTCINEAGMFGTHSASHRPLATLSRDSISADIVESLEFFESIGIKTVKSISYPYGGTSAVNKDVVSVSRGLGFEFGLTMHRGVNDADKLFNSKLELYRNSCSDIIIPQ